MEKNIIELLKLFIEKYLYQTLISVVVSIFCVAFFPDIFGIYKRMGKFIYGIFLFCITFLIISIIIYFKTTIKKKIQQTKYEREKNSCELQEDLENLWTYVDSLSVEDRNYLKIFLDNGNAPIERNGYPFIQGLFTNTNIILCTEKEKKPIKTQNQDEIISSETFYHIYNSCVTQNKLYRLRNEFYELLKYSYENYHKISHFDLME